MRGRTPCVVQHVLELFVDRRFDRLEVCVNCREGGGGEEMDGPRKAIEGEEGEEPTGEASRELLKNGWLLIALWRSTTAAGFEE